ncbi:hypothetical protein VTI74DRAFT_4518 [Chaetomium olivicolor]
MLTVGRAPCCRLAVGCASHLVAQFPTSLRVMVTDPLPGPQPNGMRKTTGSVLRPAPRQASKSQAFRKPTFLRNSKSWPSAAEYLPQRAQSEHSTWTSRLLLELDKSLQKTLSARCGEVPPCSAPTHDEIADQQQDHDSLAGLVNCSMLVAEIPVAGSAWLVPSEAGRSSTQAVGRIQHSGRFWWKGRTRYGNHHETGSHWVCVRTNRVEIQLVYEERVTYLEDRAHKQQVPASMQIRELSRG